MNVQDIPLRERKHAKTKVALANVAIERLKKKRLKDISVKELCEAIPISEVTFYNYFSQKTDVLVYILQLWQLEIQWHLKKWEKEKSNLDIVESYFDLAAQELEEHPLVLKEALAFFSQRRGDVEFEDMSAAEKLLAYPDLPGIEKIRLSKRPKEKKVLKPYVEKAIAQGELPESTDPELISNILNSLFIGTLMSLHDHDPKQMKPTLRHMLRLLWKGLHAIDPENAYHVVAENIRL